MKALIELRQRSKGYEPVQTEDDFDQVPSQLTLNNKRGSSPSQSLSRNLSHSQSLSSDNLNNYEENINEEFIFTQSKKKESKFCKLFFSLFPLFFLISTSFSYLFSLFSFFLSVFFFESLLDAWCVLMLSISGVIFLTIIAIILKSNSLSLYIKLSKINDNKQNKSKLGDSVIGAAMMYVITALLAVFYILKSPKRHLNHHFRIKD